MARFNANRNGGGGGGGSAQQRQQSEHKGPVWNRRYRISGGANLEVAVFENTVTGDGGEFSVFSVKATRNYKDGNDWKQTTSFRAEDLPVLTLALGQAYHFVTEETHRE